MGFGEEKGRISGGEIASKENFLSFFKGGRSCRGKDLSSYYLSAKKKAWERSLRRASCSEAWAGPHIFFKEKSLKSHLLICERLKAVRGARKGECIGGDSIVRRGKWDFSSFQGGEEGGEQSKTKKETFTQAFFLRI